MLYQSVGIFIVAIAHNGREALRKTLAENPDIIILDNALPDVDIKEIHRGLQESSRTGSIPIIIMGARKIKRPIALSNADRAIDYMSALVLSGQNCRV